MKDTYDNYFGVSINVSCYIHYNFNGKNYFGNNKKIGKEYYDGTTGIVPVDDCIKKAFENGYLHHIERLMVVGNYMNLDGIKPMDGMRWFIEFSCDSYEWVMHQNVLDMVFCVKEEIQCVNHISHQVIMY